MAARRAKKSKKKTKAKRSVAAKIRRGAKAVRRSVKRPKAKTAKRAKAKAPARKATKASKTRKSTRKEVLGEGNYTATRAFDKEQTDFVKKNRKRIPAMAKEAEKELEGPQGDDLRRAEEEAKSHAHTEEAAE